MVVVGVIASAVGIAWGFAIDWFPIDASTQARQIDNLYDLLIVLTVPIFVGVTVIVLFCAWKFRMRPGEEHLDGPPIHGNTKLEVVWTAIPAIMLVLICSWAYVKLTDIEEAQAGEMRVNVTGQQFAWTYEYPQASGKPIKSTTLYLPKDRPVRFFVQAKDVLHDFWVPAFRMKIDAVPGIDTHLRVNPTLRGTFPVVCAALCGLGHSVMRQDAHVVSKAAFDTWLRNRARGPAPRGGGGQQAGGGARRPRASRCSTPPAARRATRSPTPRRREPSARTSTRRSRARTRPSSARRSSTRTPRSRRATPRT